MKKLKPPIMWCMRQSGGYLMHRTLAFSKSESQQALFEFMGDEFRQKYWKRWAATLRAYRRMGYRAIRVKVAPVK